MPQAYVEKFSLSQFSVPPLSGALVKKTFRNILVKIPRYFLEFSSESVGCSEYWSGSQSQKNGQEGGPLKFNIPESSKHFQQFKIGKTYIAMKMFNIRKEGSESYFKKKAEDKLYEETNYDLELSRSEQIAKNVSLRNIIKFPKMYPEFHVKKIITMDFYNENIWNLSKPNIHRKL